MDRFDVFVQIEIIDFGEKSADRIFGAGRTVKDSVVDFLGTIFFVHQGFFAAC